MRIGGGGRISREKVQFFALAIFIWRSASEFFSAKFSFDPAALGGTAGIWQHI